jgi:DNA-binding NarL/FixJ family response regulator
MGSSCIGREAKIRLVLVDDRASVRRGLRMRLALEPDLEIVGEADRGPDAVPLVAAVHPHVVLMDVVMPDGDGIVATTQLLAEVPGVAVVMLSLYDDPATVTRSLDAGAAAFVPKHRVDELLLPTIRQVATGA